MTINENLKFYLIKYLQIPNKDIEDMAIRWNLYTIDEATNEQVFTLIVRSKIKGKVKKPMRPQDYKLLEELIKNNSISK